MTDALAASFAVGDRVRIVARNHPWSGHAGTISGPFKSASAPDLNWTVAIDGQFQDTAVAEREIRQAR